MGRPVIEVDKRARADEIFAHLEHDGTPDVIENAVYRLHGIATDFNISQPAEGESVPTYLKYYATALREIAEGLAEAVKLP